ncbi:MAG: 30S ribosomal protein S8 [Nanoarchaeota archaeon]
MKHDTLADMMSNILNAERTGKSATQSTPNSKLNLKVLEIMKERGYIKSFEVINNREGGILKIQLNGRINNCGAIKPRFSVSVNEIEKFEKRYLPARGFGVIMLSTTKGVIMNYAAKEEKIGGTLLAFCY